MMKKIKIAGHTFELLSQLEAKQETQGCQHIWQPYTKKVVVNPGGEFVKGYGSEHVLVSIASGKICQKCGFAQLDTELDRAIASGKLESVLTAHSPNRTICQMLRDLRKTHPESADEIDSCLLVAKKMDSKLVEYAGTDHATSWYDKDGKFITEE